MSGLIRLLHGWPPMSEIVDRTGGIALWKRILLIYGIILGGGPDTFDYLSALFGWTQRWELYSMFHHFKPWWMLIVGTLPWLEHIVSDLAFHDPARPGWDWWPQMGWLEIIMYFGAALMLWYAFSFEIYREFEKINRFIRGTKS
jgi:hypothetical protein